MKFVPKKITRTIGRKVLQTKKNSPHMFFAAGLAGVVGSTVLACRSTLKLDQTLDEIKKDLDQVPNFDDHSKSEQEHYQELGVVYIRSAVKIGKLYGPSIIVGTAAVVALTGSHVQMTRRNTALTMTLAAVSKAYEAYRVRIREEVGEERELELYRDIREQTVEMDGHKQLVKVSDPNKFSVYSRIFDEYSRCWEKDPEINRMFVQCQQTYANHLLHSRGHVFLNEVYDSLGLERSRAGAVVGWVMDGEGDNYIDFGLYEASSSPFVNNFECSIVLDFNVDGVIFDKI